MSESLPSPVQSYLSRRGLTDARVVALTGDASDRRYFRVLPAHGDTFVLAVSAAPFTYASLPFVNIAELFAAMPVPVPRILGHEDDLGVLALEDLGDVTLQAHLGSAPPARHAALYREAVAFIDTVQKRGRELADPRFVPYGVAFDVEKLTWELDFFVKHYLGAYRGVTFDPAEGEAVAKKARRSSPNSRPSRVCSAIATTTAAISCCATRGCSSSTFKTRAWVPTPTTWPRCCAIRTWISPGRSWTT